MDVDTLLDQVLDHFILVLVDCVEDSSLRLGISMVAVGSKLDHMLDRVDVAFADGVVNGRLAILIRLVHIDVMVTAEVLNRLVVPLTGNVEQRCLLQ